MPSFSQGAGSPPGDMHPPERRALPIGPGLSLVHDPCVHRGKTLGMDKGLFLMAGGRLCAGESAGIGLPVLKTRGQTIFPRLVSMRSPEAFTLEKTFSMDKALQWHMGTRKAPPLFARAMELLVDVYMVLPALQHGLLRLRSSVLNLLAAGSSMEAVEPRGSCLVTCEACPGGLTIHVDATGLKGKGTLILLNEVEGETFTRLRKGATVLQGRGIPAWKKASFGHCLESPSLGVGISLAPETPRDESDFRLFCGREQGLMLDWAGFALTCRVPVFSYCVRFAREGTVGWEAC